LEIAKLFTAEEVFQAYYDCRQNKRNSQSQIDFEMNMERNLVRLTNELNSGDYRIGRSIVFVITYPKCREVWAAQFRDRVVHHVLYNRVSDFFHRRFINDSYACIPGRGNLYGASRLEKYMRSVSENYQKKAYFLQADLKNFFVTIDKNILLNIINRYPLEEETFDLLRYILFHDATRDPILNCSKEKFNLVPHHKRLGGTGDTGLPIGNLSSQFFANIYLNELDQYVKRVLGVKAYGRYVDDLYMISQDMQFLNDCFYKMQSFVKDRLAIEFHPNKTSRNTLDKGVNFCGYVVKPYRKYVRRRSTNAMINVAQSKQKTEDFEKWKERINSYLSLCRHASTYKLRKQIAIYSGAAFNGKLEYVKRA
jgi:hypothetical protein